ncbi:MAG: acyl-CoA dehydrogenase family protein, partial [Candidatus Krumholzibacteria bacterium]|nr:acyl-CoA dehydrogenase family protein [Candidatus Krumholzibacteria bacterium]
MDWTFTDEQKMLKDMVRKFVNNELKPIASKIDEEHEIPDEIIKQCGELGFLGI